MSNRSSTSRRGFLRKTGAAAAGALVGTAAAGKAAAAPSANETIRVALIGCGGMGTRHLEALCKNPACRVVAVCDCYIPRYEQAQERAQQWGETPEGYQDFRRILDDPGVDAIFIATPDHWHPLMTILGCEAGKDVYVEKPISTTVEEGRAMVAAARRYGRVVQVGTQQRSMPIFQKAVDIIHGGALGPITSAGCWVGANFPVVTETPQEPPEGLDWDLYLGPAPKVPYSPERQFNFRAWEDYARGGELTNWGVHLMDIVHWGIEENAPLNVQAIGGSYVNGAGADNYQVIESIFEYPGCNVSWEQRLNNSHDGRFYGMRFEGTQGRLLMDRGSFTVQPEALGIERYAGKGEQRWADPRHHNNFFECVKTRERPIADIEKGHRATTTVLLAGVALKVGRSLSWDAKAEDFMNDPQAARHLTRPYREPWHLQV